MLTLETTKSILRCVPQKFNLGVDKAVASFLKRQ
jgi:hypothetical protein